MKHILIPTDFSETAQNALNYGLELALLSNARCTFVHAAEIPYDFATQVENRIVAIRRNARQKLEKQVSQLKNDSRFAKLDITIHVEEGSPERIVLDLAEEKKADLIVIGLSKHDGFGSFISGDPGSEVIDDSPVPVLAVPSRASFAIPKELIYAAEYREEDIQNLEELSQWAKLFNVKLRVIHIDEKRKQKGELHFRGFKGEVEDRVSYPYIVHELREAEEVESGILAAVAETEGVILAMAHYRKSFLKEIFGRSHTKAIALKTQVPLLVFHETEV